MKRRLGLLLAVAFALSCVADLTSAKVTTLASPSGVSNTPGGIAVDEKGNVYSADFGGSTVLKINPDGSASVFLQNLKTPSGNAFDSKGNFYQSNYRDQANPGANDTITRRSAKGKVTTWAQNLSGPVGIAVDGDDVLFVVQCDANNVIRIPKKNRVEVLATSNRFNCPNGITRDEVGNLYVVNFNDPFVIQIRPNGHIGVFAQVPGTGNGHITYVAGNLYLSSRTGHQIWQVSVKNRKVKLLAGSGTPGQADGANTQAQFNQPNAVARNHEGSRVFTNGVNGVVRQISLKLPKPKQPKKAKARVLSSTELRLSWKHTSLNREGFSIQLSTDGAGFEEVATAGPTEKSVVIENLTGATTYFLRVRAFNGTGKSKFSRRVRLVTP